MCPPIFSGEMLKIGYVWKQKKCTVKPHSSCGIFFTSSNFFHKTKYPQIPTHTNSQMPLGRLYVFFKPEQSSGYGSSLRNGMVKKMQGFVVHHRVKVRETYTEFERRDSKKYGVSGKKKPPAPRLFWVCQISCFFRWTFQKTIPTLDKVHLSPSIILNEQKIRIEFLLEKCEYLSEMRECTLFFPNPFCQGDLLRRSQTQDVDTSSPPGAPTTKTQWFRICFEISRRCLGKMNPIWRAYFSSGWRAKPPTILVDYELFQRSTFYQRPKPWIICWKTKGIVLPSYMTDFNTPRIRIPLWTNTVFHGSCQPRFHFAVYLDLPSTKMKKFYPPWN